MAVHGQLTVAAILVAAGSGSRLAAGVPKAFCLVRGRPLVVHAVSRFAVHPDVRDVVVVVPASHLAQAAELVGPGRSAGDAATRNRDDAVECEDAVDAGDREGGVGTADVVVVAGGASRQASVAAGLAALRADVDAVLVHDVARPFVPAEVITRVVQALRSGADAVIPAVPVSDTIKRVSESDLVVDTLDRTMLRAVQTPQGFRRDVLVAAHALASPVTDDAALVEQAGGTVVVVEGADEAFKITRPWDLLVAEALAP